MTTHLGGRLTWKPIARFMVYTDKSHSLHGLSGTGGDGKRLDKKVEKSRACIQHRMVVCSHEAKLILDCMRALAQVLCTVYG